MKQQMMRWGSLLLAAALCLGLMAGCNTADPQEESSDTLSSPSPTVSGTEAVPTSAETSGGTSATSAADGSGTQNSSQTTAAAAAETTKMTQTTKTTKATAGTTRPAAVDKFDKPTVKNTAALLNPMSSAADAQADALRNKVLGARDQIKKGTGKTYYVSPKGDDNNDGLSAKTPKRTYSFGLQLRSGDAVLFERGGVYRTTIGAVSGVSYGAYGSGDKPCLYGSRENSAKTAWRKYADNIWESPQTYASDVGLVVFNHGEHAGAKETAITKMSDKYDFTYANGRVYIYSDKEPSGEFDSIEIGYNRPLIQVGTGVHDVHIDNLTLKYTGGHGISCLDGVKNITITNCEIGWIGGSYLTGYKDGTARFGNGVEFWEGCDNVRVENCWIYQIYDTGLSHQGKQNSTVNKLTFKDNLVEYTSYNAIEYWSSGKMTNILYEGNILRFSGYGWGELNRPARQACTIGTAGADNRCENFVIRQNVLDIAGIALFSVGSKAGTYPTLDGNTYIQTRRAFLGSFRGSQKYTFGKEAETIIKNEFGDPDPKVIQAG